MYTLRLNLSPIATVRPRRVRPCPGATCFVATRLLQSAVPLGMFVGSTVVAITFMGGVYAILPAYEADLFG